MSTKRRRITDEEQRRALSIALRAADSSGVTPAWHTSLSRVLDENGVERVSYLIHKLVLGGIIERIPGSYRYQLLRGTLERNDELSLPDQIADIKSKNGEIVGGSASSTCEDMAWYVNEVEGLLELNEQLVREHDERDIREAALNDLIRELRSENKELQEANSKQEKDFAVAKRLVDDYNERGSKIGKLEYENNKLSKKLADVQKKAEAESSLRRAAEEKDLQQSRTVDRLTKELSEHTVCISGEAANHIYTALSLIGKLEVSDVESV